jgi:hypothetical protein
MITKNDRFAWKQLNGPQATVVEDTIRQYHIDSYDDHLEYFKAFGIEKANSEHLSFIGRLMRFPRPIILPQEKWSMYLKWMNYSGTGGADDPPLPKSESGFAPLPNPEGKGGVFRADDGSDYAELDTMVYRNLLRHLAETGSARGLDTIDYLAYNLLVLNGARVPYRIEYLGKDGLPNKYKDITVIAEADCGYNAAVFITLMDKLFDTIPVVTLKVKG